MISFQMVISQNGEDMFVCLIDYSQMPRWSFRRLKFLSESLLGKNNVLTFECIYYLQRWVVRTWYRLRTRGWDVLTTTSSSAVFHHNRLGSSTVTDVNGKDSSELAKNCVSLSFVVCYELQECVCFVIIFILSRVLIFYGNCFTDVGTIGPVEERAINDSLPGIASMTS